LLVKSRINKLIISLKKFQSIFGVDNSWFYTEMPWWGKICLIYIRGDLFVLLPILLFIFIIGFISLKWMMIILGGLSLLVKLLF